jgi:hypothetical protein
MPSSFYSRKSTNQVANGYSHRQFSNNDLNIQISDQKKPELKNSFVYFDEAGELFGINGHQIPTA